MWIYIVNRYFAKYIVYKHILYIAGIYFINTYVYLVFSQLLLCYLCTSSLITKCFGKQSSPLLLQGELPPSVQLPAALLSGADDCTLDGADKERRLELKDSRDREITPPLLHLDKLSLHTENPFRHPCEEVLPSGLESLPEKSGAEEFLTGNFTRGSADLSLPAVGL